MEGRLAPARQLFSVRAGSLSPVARCRSDHRPVIHGAHQAGLQGTRPCNPTRHSQFGGPPGRPPPWESTTAMNSPGPRLLRPAEIAGETPRCSLEDTGRVALHCCGAHPLGGGVGLVRCLAAPLAPFS